MIFGYRQVRPDHEIVFTVVLLIIAAIEWGFMWLWHVNG